MDIEKEKQEKLKEEDDLASYQTMKKNEELGIKTDFMIKTLYTFIHLIYIHSYKTCD